MGINFVIKTKRLIIRPLEVKDYEIWQRTLTNLPRPKNKWDARYSTKMKSEYTLKKFREHCRQRDQKRKSDSFYGFGVFLKSSGDYIGNMYIMDVSRMIFQNAYLGYGLYNPYWGKGYGREACQATIDFAFKKLNLHRLEAGVSPHNKRSIQLAKALGMRRESLSKRRLYLDNKWQDMVLYVITSEDRGIKWNPKKATLPTRR